MHARAKGPSLSRHASRGKKEQHGEHPGAMPAHPEPDGRSGARRIPLYYGRVPKIGVAGIPAGARKGAAVP